MWKMFALIYRNVRHARRNSRLTRAYLISCVDSGRSIPLRMLCGDGSPRLFCKVRRWTAVLLSVPPELGLRHPLQRAPRHLQIADKRLGINYRLACFITWTLGCNVITGEYKFSATEPQEEGCKQMNSNTRSENRVEAFAVSQADLKTLEMWVSRYRRVLYFVAHRLLGNHTDAEEAVQSCIRSIPRKVPSLEHEGGFRAWLVRVLISEALAIRHKNRFRSLMKGSACGLLMDPRRQLRIDPCVQFKENGSWTAMESAGERCR